MKTNPEEYNVSGLYLRGYLAALRKLAASQYERLLQQSGLAEYATKYPPATTEPVAKGRQLVDINMAVTRLVGPEMFHLFMSNMGRTAGRQGAAWLPLRAAVAQVGPVETRDQLLEIVQLVVNNVQNSIEANITVQEAEAPNTINLIYHYCSHCARHTNLVKPACPGITYYYKEILYELTRLHCQVTEVFCVGMHHDETDCHFIIRLPANY